MRGNVLILINDIVNVHPATDCSLFIADCLAENFDVEIGLSDSLSFVNNKYVVLKCTFSCSLLCNKTLSLELFSWENVDEKKYLKVFFRADIPQDIFYIQSLQLLHLVGSGRNKTINPINVLLSTNSKLLLLDIPPNFRPLSIVSGNSAQIIKWFDQYHPVIIKPLNSCLSKDVRIMHNISDLQLYLSTHVAQTYILEVLIADFWKRELRIWFINYEFMFAVQKHYDENCVLNYSNSFFIEKCTLTTKEKEVILFLQTFLKQKRIALAGVDIIQGLVTDINIESPGLLREASLLLGKKKMVKRSLIKLVLE